MRQNLYTKNGFKVATSLQLFLNEYKMPELLRGSLFETFWSQNPYKDFWLFLLLTGRAFRQNIFIPKSRDCITKFKITSLKKRNFVINYYYYYYILREKTFAPIIFNKFEFTFKMRPLQLRIWVKLALLLDKLSRSIIISYIFSSNLDSLHPNNLISECLHNLTCFGILELSSSVGDCVFTIVSVRV